MSPNASAPRAAVVACACALVLVAVPTAQARPVHQVAPGESLTWIAAQNGLSVAALAAANGLPPTAGVRAGQTVEIPSAGQTPASAPGAATPPGTGADSAPAGTPAVGGRSGSGGSIVVRPGDTLSGIAGRAGVSVARLAAANGVTASALLPAGRALVLPAPGTTSGTGASTPAATADAPGSTADPGTSGATASSATADPGTAGAAGATTAAPATAPGSGTRVTAADVGSTATAAGVPASLARAIAWQESGFDNGAVSSAGARGVMQVMPGTWSWIEDTLSTRRLDPASATDNVQAGTLYLQHLLRQTGGDPDQAAAAYYQGLASVRTRGLYDDTKRYVENVRALRQRFGG